MGYYLWKSLSISGGNLLYRGGPYESRGYYLWKSLCKGCWKKRCLFCHNSESIVSTDLTQVCTHNTFRVMPFFFKFRNIRIYVQKSAFSKIFCLSQVIFHHGKSFGCQKRSFRYRPKENFDTNYRSLGLVFTELWPFLWKPFENLHLQPFESSGFKGTWTSDGHFVTAIRK